MTPVNSVNLINFTHSVHSGEASGKQASKHPNSDSSFLDRVANISDDEIVLSSLKHADDKVKASVPAKLLKTLAPLFILAVPLAYGAMQKGNIVKEGDKIIKSNVLSTKAGAALKSGAILAGTVGLLDSADNFKERLQNASENVKKFSENHPIVSAAGDFALKAGLVFGAVAGIFKGKNYLAKKFAPSAEAISKSLQAGAEKLDSTKLGQKAAKLSDSFSQFSNRHPNAQNFVRKNGLIFPVIGWFGLTGSLALKIENDRSKIAGNTAADLVAAREFAKFVKEA